MAHVPITPWIRILLPVLVVPALGAAVGITTQTGVDGWYQSLQRPSFTPPDWAFGATWTVLYILMGIALGRLWVRADRVPHGIFLHFFVQLLLNLSWSYAFFTAHWLWASALWVAALGVHVVFLIYRLWACDRTSSMLLLPYLGWLGFAATLSISIAIHN